MESRHEQSIADLMELIRQTKEKLMDLKKAVNTLAALDDRPPVFADAAEAEDDSAIRRDRWYGQPLSTAIREYLEMRRAANVGPATVNEIYDALVSGGYTFETKDADNAKRGLRISLRKNSSIFHRLPGGSHYGLIEWYPEAKARKDRDPDDDDAGETTKPRRSKPRKGADRKARGRKGRAGRVVGAPPAASSRVAYRQSAPAAARRVEGGGKAPALGAVVREALAAMEGEFTKPAIVAWIDHHYPNFGAAARKASIFTTINSLRDEFDIRMVQESRSGAPGVYRSMSKKESNGQH